MNLPGTLFNLGPRELYKNHVCEVCEERNPPKAEKAVVKLQGETDSFGAEYTYMCAAHLTEYKIDVLIAKRKPCHCDWCKKPTTDTTPFRDTMDEGSHGPVYEVCKACRIKYNESVDRELGRNQQDEDDGDEYDNSADYADEDD